MKRNKILGSIVNLLPEAFFFNLIRDFFSSYSGAILQLAQFPQEIIYLCNFNRAQYSRISNFTLQ